MKTIESQKKKIKSAFGAGAILTPSWAWNKVGCSKLSTRIGELEQDGQISRVYRKRMEKNGKSFMAYSRKPFEQDTKNK